MKILYVNACVRENSRTKIISDEFLKELTGDIVEIVLNEENIKPLDKNRLSRRDELINDGNFDDEIFSYAKQFANADEIVVSAPFWDLSFPSLLKIYFENVTVGGITFRYDKGKPIGLCNAKKLTYFTTAGGPIFEDFGYTYVKSLAKNFFGIEEVVCFRVENLDVKMVDGKDVLKEKIIKIE